MTPMPTDLPERPSTPHSDPGGAPGNTSPVGDKAKSTQAKAPPPLQAIFAAVTLAALATLVLMPVLGEHGGRSEPFLVAISPPRVEHAGSLATQHLRALTMAVQDAAERHLSGRTGLLWTPVPESADDAEAARAAREAGADEALVLTINCDSVCRGSVRRIRSVDASITWQRPKFLLKLENPLEIERTLGDQLAVAYLKFTRREGAPKLFAHVEDYRRFLEMRRQLETMSAPITLADGLSELRRTSPRFFSSYLYEASIRGQAGDDDARVVELLENAHRIAPADPRPLVQAIPLLVRLGRTLEAKDLLNELETLYPRHPDLETLRQLTVEKAPDGVT